jgi:ribosomal protein S18 acetylase RimI-like enzyme
MEVTPAREPMTDTDRDGLRIRPFGPQDREALIALWAACDLLRPWNDADRDVDRKLGQDPRGLLVLEVGSVLVGAVMAGYDGHRGWINYLGVLPGHRRFGYGKRLVAAAESYLNEIGCPKVNLQIRRSNQEVIDFYRRLGYNTDEVVSMGKRLVVDGLQDQGRV